MAEIVTVSILLPRANRTIVGFLKIAKKDSIFARTFSMKRTPTNNRRGVIKIKINKIKRF